MSTPNPFAPHLMVPLPIYTTVLAGFEAHEAPMLAEILALRAQYPGVQRSNRRAWHSGEEFLRHRSEHVAWMLARVLRFAEGALAGTYGGWKDHELRLASAWANVLGSGGWNAPHHHFPLHWSGVFYVSTPGIAGNAPGDPSGHIEFLNPTPWLSPMGQGGNAAFAPKPGMTVLFPSSLYHYVHPHTAEEPRVSIAYNLLVVQRTK
jgi:uncharacterized protein (TIGR02466 family)